MLLRDVKHEGRERVTQTDVSFGLYKARSFTRLNYAPLLYDTVQPGTVKSIFNMHTKTRGGSCLTSKCFNCQILNLQRAAVLTGIYVLEQIVG